MPKEEKEEEFKVVDKRRLLSEEAAQEEEREEKARPPSSTPLEEPKAPTPKETESAPPAEEKGRIQVPGSESGADIMIAIRLCMKILSDNAFFLLGLVRHPETGQIVKDPHQAKVAIDCLQAIFEKTKEQFNELEKKELRALLSELQMNYLSQAPKNLS